MAIYTIIIYGAAGLFTKMRKQYQEGQPHTYIRALESIYDLMAKGV
jgi:hypothetical protein